MDASSAPWWFATLSTVGASASAAVVYLWKQREKRQDAERARMESLETAARAKADAIETATREATAARIKRLEDALSASEQARIADHATFRSDEGELYEAAMEREKTARDLLRDAADMPRIVREGIDTMHKLVVSEREHMVVLVRQVIREENDRISGNPTPTPKKPMRGDAR